MQQLRGNCDIIGFSIFFYFGSTMKLTITRNKNNTTYYLCETFRVGKKVSSRTISRIGTEKELKAKFGEDFDAEQYARDFVAKANKAQEENKPLPVTLQFNTNELTNLDEQRIVDVGYLPLQKILYGLGIDKQLKKLRININCCMM